MKSKPLTQPFIIGQRVKCIKPVDGHVFCDKVYIINDVTYSKRNWYVSIEARVPARRGWFASRFAKIEEGKIDKLKKELDKNEN